MYLVMMNNKPSPFEEMNVRKLLVEASGAEHSYDGESMKQIKLNLEKERDDTVVVSADSRLLQLVPTHFPMESVYLFEGGVLVKIQDTTARHNSKTTKDIP